jgi:exonuclease SbcC
VFELLHVSGFQKHEDRVVDLNHPVTCLTGPTEAGKSSLVRALYWLCLNRPSGDSFLKLGGDSATVRLKCDGRKVLRKRGGGNYYRLDGTKLEAMGSDVPDPVAAVLGVCRDNFQLQHDPPYWLSLPPGELSKELNKALNLGVIDSTLANAKSDLRKAETVAEASREQLRDAEKAEQELEWVEEYASRLKKLEALETRHAASASKTALLADLLKRLREVGERAERARRCHRSLGAVVRLGQKAKQTADRRKSLETTLAKLNKIKSVLARGRPDPSRLLEVRKRADAQAERRRSLEYLLEEANNKGEELCRVRNRLEALNKRLSTFGELCPACRRPLGHSQSCVPTSTPPKKSRPAAAKPPKSGWGW